MAKSGKEKSGKGGAAFGVGGLTLTPTIKDALWKDMLRHEKNLEHLWHWKWDSLLEPEYWPPFKLASINQIKKVKGTIISPSHMNKEEKLYHIMRPPPPPVPIKSSETIGWLSTKKEYSFEMFPTKPTRPKKIRFQDEQYGLLRMKKYLQDTKETPEFSLPTRKIVHKINPILC